jgi:hypothetical protein
MPLSSSPDAAVGICPGIGPSGTLLEIFIDGRCIAEEKSAAGRTNRRQLEKLGLKQS